jgi:hypothetical protein
MNHGSRATRAGSDTMPFLAAPAIGTSMPSAALHAAIAEAPGGPSRLSCDGQKAVACFHEYPLVSSFVRQEIANARDAHVSARILIRVDRHVHLRLGFWNPGVRYPHDGGQH